LKDDQPYYSVVVPVYNSRHSIELLLEEITNTLSGYNHEIIAVDDCSTDSSWEVLLKNRDRYNLKILRNSKNLGQGETTWIGVKSANGRFVVTIDDDLEFEPRDILILAMKQRKTNADLVYGIPQRIEKSFYRRLGSALIGNLSPMARGSSFRMINRKAIEALVPKNFNALIDIELQKNCKTIQHVVVSHNKRVYGNSNYSVGRLIKLFFHSVIQVYFSKKTNEC
jgi:polyisoprenyl-phosphate glycosyltransferase